VQRLVADCSSISAGGRGCRVHAPRQSDTA
jgi:hypothetical protein